MSRLLASVSSLSQGSPDSTRLNEDACYFSGTGDELYLLVADGAAVRASTAALDRFLAERGGNQTAASYAARLTCDTAAQLIDSGVHPSPEALLLAANAALRATVEEIFGGITSDAFRTSAPDLPQLEDDPRLMRLALPICVATAVRIDLTAATLQFAQAGDTALFVRRADDLVSHIAGGTGERDHFALGVAWAKQQANPGSHVVDFLQDSETLGRNRYNGIYHNYVDANGNIDRSVGIGVINGLPQLSEYIHRGSVDLGDMKSVLVCSDGFIWPSNWDETPSQAEQRRQRMGQLLAEEGLAGYFRHLRAVESADAQLDTYPRFKVHDDATAIYVELLPV
ncbi:MAG TPA: hypothetical protein VF120_10215 [Ktedonobacterales bacterium]